MNSQEKQVFFEKASQGLLCIVGKIEDLFTKTKKENKQIREDLPKINADSKIVQQRLLEHGVQRARELESLIPSPYFVRCLVRFSDQTQDEMYFGKFSLSDEHIYSWVTPVSAIRFEKPGKVSYIRPDGEKRVGVLCQKDQYMITDGQIIFLASESIDQERELIFQEYFSKQKKDFLLPEIVAQMEKAQDAVIRANHRGPLLISGPAGSGKTTLALHRVAYLAQSPDVSDIFSPTSIIVFVQDEGTRDYFSHLLPELGIQGVTITTFAQWAMRVLDLNGFEYIFRFGKSEKEKDVYEFKKRIALKKLRHGEYKRNVYAALEQSYSNFSAHEKQMLVSQKEKKQLDRFDLTVLLTLFKKDQGTLSAMQEYYEMGKNNSATKKVGRFPVSYSLMIFDEFQNYLPEQILLAKSTLEEKHHAVMYVGDMAQQTQLGTIQSWDEAGERVQEKRQVVLQKVYRNTKNILMYIKDVGYDIEIIDSLKEGEPVVEKVIASKKEEIAYVSSIAKEYSGSIGILAKDEAYLEDFGEIKKMGKNVHLMSMNEAQGVEFDMVVIVGISKEMFAVEYDELYEGLVEEKKRMNKDLLYVALTRAIDSLHVVGDCSLKEAVSR